MRTLWKLRRGHVLLVVLFLVPTAVSGALWLALQFEPRSFWTLLGITLVAAPVVGAVTVLMAVAIVADVRGGKFQPTSSTEINPSTGLPMVGGVDVGGNVYGTSRRDD